jgi:hypothetical protein
MLSTLREFAADRLAVAEQTAERRARHARFYADLAAAAEPGLRTAEEATWVTRLNADFSNLHAVHLWAMENGDVDLDARLLVSLCNYGLQTLSAEYFRWVEEAFDSVSFDEHPQLADLHGIVALGAWLRGDLRQCMHSCQSAFDAEQRLGSGISLPARMALIIATAYSPPGGDLALAPVSAQAPSRFLEIVTWSRAQGEPWWLVYSLVNGSLGMMLAGDTERAVTLAGRALHIARDSGCLSSLAWALFAMATAVEQSHPDRCEALLEESVRAARAVENRMVLGVSMSLLATVHRRLGHPLDALPLLLELIDQWDRVRDLPQLWHTIRESAICLGALGANQTAVRLLARVEQAELVMPLLPHDRAHVTEVTEQLREHLGAQEYAAAAIIGAQLTREEAVGLATRSLVEIRDMSSPAH